MTKGGTMKRGVIVVWLAVAGIGGAQAQLFKCKGPDGKIVYSDTRCESSAASGALPAGVSNRAHENEAKAAMEKAAADKAAAEEKVRAEALVEAAKKAGLVAPPAPQPGQAAGAPKLPEPYKITDADRERIRSLEIDASRQGASTEQKRAARMEIDNIRAGREARLSSEDRARRESLNADLVSADAKKRRQAVEQLQSIYYR
jgi:hypothetical protein